MVTDEVVFQRIFAPQRGKFCHDLRRFTPLETNSPIRCRPLTVRQICAIIYPLKAVMKTRAKVRFPERMPHGERRLYPCFCDTTSEPQRRNALPDAPVIVQGLLEPAEMSMRQRIVEQEWYREGFAAFAS